MKNYEEIAEAMSGDVFIGGPSQSSGVNNIDFTPTMIVSVKYVAFQRHRFKEQKALEEVCWHQLCFLTFLD